MARATIKDYEEVTAVLARYVEGMVSGKSEIMKPSFHKDATMYGYVPGVGLSAGSIQNLYNIVDGRDADPKRKTRIDILEIVDTIATARVVIEGEHGPIFTDFHHLLKIDNEWRIISKIFHQHVD